MKNIISLTYSRFTSWLAYNPPGALSSRSWDLFNDEFKRVAPIRHWFHHDFRRKYVYPVKWKYESISGWVRYRTYDKYHTVYTGLPPGYQGADTIMLHMNFNLLKDYVEVDKASRQDYAASTTWCERNMPFYRVFYKFRRPDLGVSHLEWETTLDDPTLSIYDQSPAQARQAREILALYKWWVFERPARDILPPVFEDHEDCTTPEYAAYIQTMKDHDARDESYHAEDTQNLIRLMGIRQGMW